MEIRYNITGPKRKEMVQIIGKVLETEPVYLRVPTCAYKVGAITVTKEGNLISENLPQDEIRKVIDSLAEAGFEVQNASSFVNDIQDQDTEKEEAIGLTISLPKRVLTDDKVDALRRLLKAKEPLIKKALGADRLAVEVTEDKISFPWFDRVPDADETRAYMHFITSICSLVEKAKRVTATQKLVDNEKYAFRCFLLRLGFIGEESKADRKILLRNLSGSAAFRKGGKE